MLATVKNDGRNVPLVAQLSESGVTAKYDIDIQSMTRFTMSDTTPSGQERGRPSWHRARRPLNAPVEYLYWL
ncbi:hypothetical protein JG687_00016969 [Phytophthora cactorum]|uniref:Uncharacterized protein n=1 Tax=Phytophthora cactorum TaxID=29920 RepID=A0A8T1TTN9_9STRA|nr:hypothetical protein JG687_00016969 [Phytophthora cactorum]